MPREPNALEAELNARVDRLAKGAKRPLNESALRDAERLARLLDLSARSRRPRTRWRLAWLAIPLAGVLAATFKQPSTEVRITVEAAGGQVVVAADEQIVLGILGEEITLSGFELRRGPAELGPVLQPNGGGDISVAGSFPDHLALERITLREATELVVSADMEAVSFHLGCLDTCAGSEVRLAAQGELRSGSTLATVEAPSSIEFIPRTSRPSIRLSRRDSIAKPLAEWVPVESAAFQQPRFLLNGDAHSLGSVSAIYSGAVTLPDYPARNRTLARGDELYIAGELRLTAVERRADRLVFSFDGRALALSLGREDLRPSWWDLIRTHVYWPILVGFLGGLGALHMLLNLIRERST